MYKYILIFLIFSIVFGANPNGKKEHSNSYIQHQTLGLLEQKDDPYKDFYIEETFGGYLVDNKDDFH